MIFDAQITKEINDCCRLTEQILAMLTPLYRRCRQDLEDYPDHLRSGPVYEDFENECDQVRSVGRSLLRTQQNLRKLLSYQTIQDFDPEEYEE